MLVLGLGPFRVLPRLASEMLVESPGGILLDYTTRWFSRNGLALILDDGKDEGVTRFGLGARTTPIFGRAGIATVCGIVGAIRSVAHGRRRPRETIIQGRWSAHGPIGTLCGTGLEGQRGEGCSGRRRRRKIVVVELGSHEAARVDSRLVSVHHVRIFRDWSPDLANFYRRYGRICGRNRCEEVFGRGLHIGDIASADL